MGDKEKGTKILYKLKKYRTGERWVFDFIYRLDQNTDLYKKVAELYKQYPEEIEFSRLSYSIDLTRKKNRRQQRLFLYFLSIFARNTKILKMNMKNAAPAG